MTMQDACAILRLAMATLTLEGARRRFREIAKRCHPDRAKYPGAAADFKRATEALRVIERYFSRGGMSDAEDRRQKIVRAAERFELQLEVLHEEVARTMTRFEQVRAFFRGCGIISVSQGEMVSEGTPLACWSFTPEPRVFRDLHPVLLAPFTCQVISNETKPAGVTFRVRPLDIATVAACLDEAAEHLGGLEQAEARLTEELRDCARVPLVVTRS